MLVADVAPSDNANSVHFHKRLARRNAVRVAPGTPAENWENEERADIEYRIIEGRYLEDLRANISPMVISQIDSEEQFVDWFESLADWGPGQDHPLFDWLANQADLSQMKWFLTQEIAGEAGFDDLLAYSQVKLPTQAKLECARNYWDEMGRGKAGAMHGPLLAGMINELGLQPSLEETVWESLALGNIMLGMATNRRYAYHSLGALGVIELTAPQRAAKVVAGMQRLGLSTTAFAYFKLHAVIDIIHSKNWIREIIRPLIRENLEYAQYIAEGALMRLHSGKLCFDRYASELHLDFSTNATH